MGLSQHIMRLYPVVEAIQEKRINYSNIDTMFPKKSIYEAILSLQIILKNIGIAIFEKIDQYSVKINVGIRRLGSLSFALFCIYS